MGVDVNAVDMGAAAPPAASEAASLERKLCELLDIIEDIAMIADGHRKSGAMDSHGNNVALSVILGLAAGAIGRSDRLRETGTIFAAPGSTVL